MLRVFATLALIIFPLAAQARCEGNDLIAALPATDRAVLETQAAATPYGAGLLWQARKGDTDFVIFGTYHFAHAKTDRHLDRLKPLIDRAESVYLEVSNEDQERLQAELANDPSLMFITSGETLPDLLGEEDWRKYSEENARARHTDVHGGEIQTVLGDDDAGHRALRGAQRRIAANRHRQKDW